MIQRDFSSQQITILLHALGTDYRGDCDSSEPLIFQTVCHNHDHSGSYKLYYYPDSQRFHCYTHCGDNFDIYELIQRARGCSFYDALLFIQQILHIDPTIKTGFADVQTGQSNDELERLDRYQKMRNRHTPEQQQVTYLPPNLINLYSRIYPVEWLNDHISTEAMDRFNIRFDISENEIIIPHYDVNGNLVGIRSRSFNQRKVDDGGKYMPTMLQGHDFRHTLRNYLYGLDKVKTQVQKTGRIVLFEAEKSALQSYSYYGSNSIAVAVCGSNISTQQRDMILSLGVKEVILGFDKQYHEAYTPESDHYADKILRLASLFTPYVNTYVLWDVDGFIGYKDSPTDHGKEIFEKLMQNRFEIKTKKEA